MFRSLPHLVLVIVGLQMTCCTVLKANEGIEWSVGVPLNKRSLVVLLFVSAWLVNVIGTNSLGASSRIIIFESSNQYCIYFSYF